jgi:transaldolase
VDATTNPSLIFTAAQKEEYHHLVEQAIEIGSKKGDSSVSRDRIVLTKKGCTF